MEIMIKLTKKVDEEIKNLYQQIVGSVEDSERQNGFNFIFYFVHLIFFKLSGFVSLNGFKGIRNQIDEVIKSLLDESPDDCDEECQKKLKKIVQRNLRGVRKKIMVFNRFLNSKNKGEFGHKTATRRLHLCQWLYTWH